VLDEMYLWGFAAGWPPFGISPALYKAEQQQFKIEIRKKEDSKCPFKRNL
jgi:hypothetical protein